MGRTVATGQGRGCAGTKKGRDFGGRGSVPLTEPAARCPPSAPPPASSTHCNALEAHADDEVAGPVGKAGHGHGGRTGSLAEQLGHNEPGDGTRTDLKEGHKAKDGHHAELADFRHPLLRGGERGCCWGDSLQGGGAWEADRHRLEAPVLDDGPPTQQTLGAATPHVSGDLQWPHVPHAKHRHSPGGQPGQVGLRSAVGLQPVASCSNARCHQWTVQNCGSQSDAGRWPPRSPPLPVKLPKPTPTHTEPGSACSGLS